MLCNPPAWHQLPPTGWFINVAFAFSAKLPKLATQSYTQPRRDLCGEPVAWLTLKGTSVPCARSDLLAIVEGSPPTRSMPETNPDQTWLSRGYVSHIFNVGLSQELCQESKAQRSTWKLGSHQQKSFEASLRGGRRGLVIEWPGYLQVFVRHARAAAAMSRRDVYGGRGRQHSIPAPFMITETGGEYCGISAGSMHLCTMLVLGRKQLSLWDIT